MDRSIAIWPLDLSFSFCGLLSFGTFSRAETNKNGWFSWFRRCWNKYSLNSKTLKLLLKASFRWTKLVELINPDQCKSRAAFCVRISSDQKVLHFLFSWNGSKEGRLWLMSTTIRWIWYVLSLFKMEDIHNLSCWFLWILFDKFDCEW